MGYPDVFFLCLLLFSGLLWHLVVVPAVVAPHGGLCSGHILGAVSVPCFAFGFGVPCSHSGVGECKA